MAKTIAELAPWPKRSDDATAETIMRIVGVETQLSWLKKWKALEADRRDEYTGHLHSVLAGVGLMMALQKLRTVNPGAADEFARDYWELCDGGDSVGETLWELAEQAGIDPSLASRHQRWRLHLDPLEDWEDPRPMSTLRTHDKIHPMNIWEISGFGIPGDVAYVEADSQAAAMAALAEVLDVAGTLEDARPQDAWTVRPADRPLRVVIRQD